MNVLLLGSGGREHAISLKLSQSPLLEKLYIAPGNAGTTATGINVPIQVTDFPAIREFVLRNQIGMIVVGPEDPLVKGIHDYFLRDPDLAMIPVIGPVKAGAMLEGSKEFAKNFMQRHGIPTASCKIFSKENLEEGDMFFRKGHPPFVLKADGLAAGKGVVICPTVEDAIRELKEMITDEKFGTASKHVVVEDFLKGIELSVFILTDGDSYKIFPEAKDYKKIGEGDTGPNTGGMGSVSPVPFMNHTLKDKIEKRIIRPTILGLKSENIDYKGFIYFGLMNVDDEPFVIEYNCRLGDPETEAVLPRLCNDLLELFIAVGNKTLDKCTITTDPRHTVTVMLVSGGYPGVYKKGFEITGEKGVSESLVFHAGTVTDQNGVVRTSGGRVMAITSFGNTFGEALERSYENAEKIHFENKYFRKDIGFDVK
ncbi:MAG: phosphoribosylamine--glycine ligase [Bacteroidetes bacterium]|nr:phosphoribosylamine--glycine ligase [Bacteroidota bacterium]